MKTNSFRWIIILVLVASVALFGHTYLKQKPESPDVAPLGSGSSTTVIDIYKTTDPSPGEPDDICFAAGECYWLNFEQGVILSNPFGSHTVTLSQSQKKYVRSVFCDCLEDFAPDRCLSTVSFEPLTGPTEECTGS